MVKSSCESPVTLRFHNLPVNGGFIRVAHALPTQNPTALVMIAPGLSEFIERYFGIINELLSKNFAVGILDWRGQGLSVRPEPMNVRLNHFDTDVVDLYAAVDYIQKEINVQIPLIFLAHSMGGAITLAALADNPHLAMCAGLSAPMCGLPVPIWSQAFLNFILPYIPGRFTLLGEESTAYARFAKNAQKLTNCKINQQLLLDQLQENPKLGMGVISYGWVYGALKLGMHLQNPATAQKIITPILMGVAGQEKIVSVNAQYAVAKNLPNVKVIDLSEAQHEILMEKPLSRDRFMTEFYTLVDRTLKTQAE